MLMLEENSLAVGRPNRHDRPAKVSVEVGSPDDNSLLSISAPIVNGKLVMQIAFGPGDKKRAQYDAANDMDGAAACVEGVVRRAMGGESSGLDAALYALAANGDLSSELTRWKLADLERDIPRILETVLVL